jgi:DNA-binding XRE family transcriptional regulator
MPNLASVLKTEISRISRKEVRAETESLKKAAAVQRSEIASLKRRIQELEKQLKALSKAAGRSAVKAPAALVAESEGDAEGLRFRAEGMASNRKRLGLSAADFGLLVGATGQSVYSWEQGKSKPRAKALATIAALRGIGKREVAKRLEALKAAE